MNTNKSFEKLNSLKSERTTFNLTKEAYNILERFSDTYEITQKETFSIILQDDELLGQVTRKIRNAKIDLPEEKSQKTKVISKGALSKLNELTRSEDFSRDIILEVALRELNSQLTNRVESHKKAKEIVDETLDKLIEKEKKLKELLSKGDPILSRWDILIMLFDFLSSAIRNELEKGVPIDPDDYAQQ